MMRSLVVLAMVVALASTASANLITNPGFEVGGVGGSWGLFGTAGTNTVAIGYWNYAGAAVENWAARSGSNGVAFQNWWDPAWGGFGQDVMTNMIVGDVVTFSVWGQFEANYTSSTKETWMKIEYWTNGASTWIQQATYDVYDILAANRGNWNQLTFVHTNTIPNVVMIKPMVGFGNGTNLGLGTSAGKWDDLDVTVVIPEPTIAALMGFGGLLFLAVRRMSRK